MMKKTYEKTKKTIYQEGKNHQKVMMIIKKLMKSKSDLDDNKRQKITSKINKNSLTRIINKKANAKINS